MIEINVGSHDDQNDATFILNQESAQQVESAGNSRHIDNTLQHHPAAPSAHEKTSVELASGEVQRVHEIFDSTKSAAATNFDFEGTIILPTIDESDPQTILSPLHDTELSDQEKTLVIHSEDLRSPHADQQTARELGTTDFSIDSHSTQTRPESEAMIGPYEIIGELGRGGMGVVYRARHSKIYREVALKMILRADGNEDLMSRFHLEAQSIATLRHPGIVQIYEYGEQAGVPWFALELVEGKNLAEISTKEPLDPLRAARIISRLAAAVAYAHDQGVLHRDIKPANVLVGEGDQPKLTDFGLAKIAESKDSVSGQSDHKTVDGQIMGTPSFMPPEQARGDQSLIGPHSDQYALGATLYYLLTGRAPFVGRQLDVIIQVMERDPLTIRQLQPNTPLDLETICLKAMAKEPARRYENCAAFEADLRRFLGNEPILARPISSLERAARWCRRNPRLATMVSIAAASILMTLSVSIWSAVILAGKNIAIEAEKKAAQLAEVRAVQNANLAEERAAEAKESAKLAYQRAVAAKDSIAQMLFAIREKIPSTEERLRPIREQLLKTASKQLDSLPDEAGDSELNTGLEKARVLQEQYQTALELGDSSQAIVYIESAEEILRKRNQSQGTNSTRYNLATLLYYEANARVNVRRDMEKVLSCGQEAMNLLNDILANPYSNPTETEHSPENQLKIHTEVMIQGYQQALKLKKLGRVQAGFQVIDQALDHFDRAMSILRKGQFQGLSEENWQQQKQNFRAMVADQDQIRTVLLASIGRTEEAEREQDQILKNIRKVVESDQSLGKVDSHLKLSLALMFAGDLARQRGQIDVACERYEESAEITRLLYLDNPQLEDRRNRHHISLMRLAGILRYRDLPRAREISMQSKLIAQQMLNVDSEVVTRQIALALVSPFSGPPAKAVELAQTIEARFHLYDAEYLIDLARVWSASAEAESLSIEPDSVAIENWKQHALSLLESAVAKEFQDRAYLRGEPDFMALRQDSRWKGLMEPNPSR
jgi:serine/threonine protein kinase